MKSNLPSSFKKDVGHLCIVLCFIIQMLNYKSEKLRDLRGFHTFSSSTPHSAECRVGKDAWILVEDSLGNAWQGVGMGN